MGKTTAPDILVIGAGIFGLACAQACAARGLSVVVAEAATPGAGSSGGPVGALSPYAPEKWNAKKALQLTTLLGAEAYWRGIHQTGGTDPGYARTGRLIPLTTAAQRARAEIHATNAATLWPAPLSWHVRDTHPGLAPEAAPFGLVVETLSARISPPRAIAALTAALTARGVPILTGTRALGLAPGGVRFADTTRSAGAVILATGFGAPLAPTPPLQGIKGQALLLAPTRHPLGPRILTADSLYVVPHADGSIALGSTTEADWTDPTSTDAALDALLARASATCPDLRDATILRRWAGIRPRGPRPEPMLGPLPDAPRVFIANAGFRTGLALAPMVGDALADMVTGAAPALPPGYTLAEHWPKPH